MQSDAPAAEALPEPNILLFLLGTPDRYRQPIFSPNEVFCSPDCTDTPGGRGWKALRSAGGEFDIGPLLARLPLAQKPDLIVVKADATGANFPRNLEKAGCPAVLILGNTQHLSTPLQMMLRYAAMEPFQWIGTDHKAHHLHFFRDAMLGRMFWNPALMFSLQMRPVPEKPSIPLSFFGQTGKFHPYRRELLKRLRQASLPLTVKSGTVAQAADCYADSQVTLNVSLNGDLNLRVFEVLGAGGFLLTDALAPESGLELLFKPGEHLDVYRTPEELVEKVRYYLAHPEEAMRIRRAGQEELLKNHAAHVKRREFFDLVFQGKENPAYALERLDTRCRVPAKPDSLALLKRAAAYEILQELHLHSLRLEVTAPRESMLREDGRDLPRIRFLDTPSVGADERPGLTELVEGPLVRQVLALEGDLPEVGEFERMLRNFRGAYVVFNGWETPAELMSALEKWGFSLAAEAPPTFGRRDPLPLLNALLAVKARRETGAVAQAILEQETRDGVLAQAGRALVAAGEDDLGRKLLLRAVSLNRGNVEALADLGLLYRRHAQKDAAYAMLVEAERQGRLEPAAAQAAQELAETAGRSPRLQPYLALVGRTPGGKAARPRKILVVTNLFPPQELGGYGRKMWEFSRGLRRRGHELSVLTGDAPYLLKTPDAGEDDLEPVVSRSLPLAGDWSGGALRQLVTGEALQKLERENAERVLAAAEAMGAEAVLAGNIDFIGMDFLEAVLARGLPVIHCVGAPVPGYPPQRTPASPRYRLGCASMWVAKAVRAVGYPLTKMTIVYPGARVDRFFRQVPPSYDRLRIAFAGLVMPYKGPQVLCEALWLLSQQGLDFTCTIAGDSTDPAFVAKLKEWLEGRGLADRVEFAGFLDRAGLTRLFARSNVLVFPTQVDEAFGISQVEAMASGLLVMTSGTGGSTEIVRHGKDGIVFKKDDPRELARALAAMAEDASLWERLALAGQMRAAEFGVERSVEVLERTFEELLGTPLPGA